jgi:hypothetical protein
MGIATDFGRGRARFPASTPAGVAGADFVVLGSSLDSEVSDTAADEEAASSEAATAGATVAVVWVGSTTGSTVGLIIRKTKIRYCKTTENQKVKRT